MAQEGDTDKEGGKAAQTVAEKISQFVSEAQDEDGTLILPKEYFAEKGVSEELEAAVRSELRHRNTQRAFTKASKQKKTLEAVNTELTAKYIEAVTKHLSKEQRTELDRLKVSDADEYLNKLNAYEAEASKSGKKEIEDIKDSINKKSEEETRQELIGKFKEDTGIDLTDEVIEAHLPPIYLKRLEKGDITFAEFLKRAKDILTKEKVIENTSKTDEELKDDEPKNLKKVGGSDRVSEDDIKGDVVEGYASVTF